MFFGVIPEPHSARSGLDKVDVTPLMYLTLRKKLESGRRVTYNETQLNLAFRKYLSNKKGPWSRDQEKHLSGFDTLAISYLKQQREEFDKGKKAFVNLPKNKKHEKEIALLKEKGLLPVREKDLPLELQTLQSTGIDKTKQTLRAVNTGTDILQAVSMMGEPTSIVAAGLCAMVIKSELTMGVCEIFLDKLKTHAENSPEVKMYTNALNAIMPPEIRALLKDKIDEAFYAKNDISDKKQINDLKAETDKKATTEKRLDFLDNMNMVKRPSVDRTTLRPAIEHSHKNPFTIPNINDTLRSGPKFTPPSDIIQIKDT